MLICMLVFSGVSKNGMIRLYQRSFSTRHGALGKCASKLGKMMTSRPVVLQVLHVLG